MRIFTAAGIDFGRPTGKRRMADRSTSLYGRERSKTGRNGVIGGIRKGSETKPEASEAGLK